MYPEAKQGGHTRVVGRGDFAEGVGWDGMGEEEGSPAQVAH